MIFASLPSATFDSVPGLPAKPTSFIFRSLSLFRRCLSRPFSLALAFFSSSTIFTFSSSESYSISSLLRDLPLESLSLLISNMTSSVFIPPLGLAGDPSVSTVLAADLRRTLRTLVGVACVT